MNLPSYIYLLLFNCIVLYSTSQSQQQQPFLQPVSIQYNVVSENKNTLLKLAVDKDDNIHVLANDGMYRISGNNLVKDRLYTSLAGKIPVDIAVQETTGYLYYLYNDHFLSNANAGIPYGKIPDGVYTKLSVNDKGDVFLCGTHALALFADDALHLLKNLQDTIVNIKAHNGKFYIQTTRSIYHLQHNNLYQLYISPTRLLCWAISTKEIWLGTADGYFAIDAETGKEVIPMQIKLPSFPVQKIYANGHNLWGGTNQGAFSKSNTSNDFRYYASRRWLNNDTVIDIVSDSHNHMYFLTPDGLNQLKYNNETYGSKAAYYEQQIRARHIRYGLLAEVRMKIPGDIATAEMIDTDNDGLWTSFYLGAQAFRYAATKHTVAKRHAWESFAAYERLLSINPLTGFPSRTFERKSYKVSDPEAWRPSQDSLWEWKGTTSSDEFVGYIFVAAVMDQFVTQTKEEKKRVADFIDAILTHIIRNNYNFMDADGKPTTWGRWHPDYINWYAKSISDRKLGSTHIIAGLQLGYALTKKKIYRDEALRLMKKHGYLDNILISPYDIKATPGYIYKGHDMGMGPWNHSDDEMEFLSFWVLYHYAFDQSLKEKYARAITEYYKIESPEKNPVWNLITLGTAGDFDKEATLWYMREFPMDLIRWNIKNSHRKDLHYIEPGFRRQYTKSLLSPAERPAQRFNSNEFTLDGGNGGSTELTGAEYLLAFWMAKYLNVITE